MPEFTFYHVLAVSRERPKNKPHKPVLRGVIAEAERRAFACKHVENPLRPRILFGCSPTEAGKLAEERAASARDKRGFKLRRDSIVLYAAVASYPIRTTEVIERDGDRIAFKDPQYLEWRARALDFAQSEYGETLKSAVEHLDEGYPHIHFFIVIDLVDGRLSHDAAHAGRRAQSEASETGLAEPKANERSSYCDAMRDLLNRYHAVVGAPFGHGRHGPGRARWARSVKLQIDRETKAIKKQQAAEAAIEKARRAADAERALDIRLAELDARHVLTISVEKARLNERAQGHIAAHRAKIDREHAIAEARRDELIYETLLSGEKSTRRLKRLERETVELRNELAGALALIEAHGLRPLSPLV